METALEPMRTKPPDSVSMQLCAMGKM